MLARRANLTIASKKWVYNSRQIQFRFPSRHFQSSFNVRGGSCKVPFDKISQRPGMLVRAGQVPTPPPRARHEPLADHRHSDATGRHLPPGLHQIGMHPHRTISTPRVLERLAHRRIQRRCSLVAPGRATLPGEFRLTPGPAHPPPTPRAPTRHPVDHRRSNRPRNPDPPPSRPRSHQPRNHRNPKHIHSDSPHPHNPPTRKTPRTHQSRTSRTSLGTKPQHPTQPTRTPQTHTRPNRQHETRKSSFRPIDNPPTFSLQLLTIRHGGPPSRADHRL